MLGSGGTWVTGIGNVQARLVTLEDKYVRTTRFATSSATSGTVTLPLLSTVVLDDFGGLVDAVLSTLSGGRPDYGPVLTAGGAIITTSFDSSGNYVLSGTPATTPYAIIYRVRQKLKDFDSTSSDIIGFPIIYTTGGSLTTNHIFVGSAGGVATDVAMSGDVTIVSSGATTIGTNVVSNAKFRQSVGTSVVGRSAGTTGNVADIVSGSDGDVLRRAGGVLGFGTIPSTSVTGILSFVTIDCPAGTDPVADSATDTLTLTTTEATIVVTGNAGTDTINFHVPGALVHPVDPSNTFAYESIPVGITGAAANVLGLGGNVLTNFVDSQDITAIGSNVLTSVSSGVLKIVGIGSHVLENLVTPSVNAFAMGVTVADMPYFTNSGIIGITAALGLATMNASFVVGVETLAGGTGLGTSQGDIIMGGNICNVGDYFGLNNVLIGNSIGVTASTTLARCIFIGNQAARAVTNAEDDIVIGSDAGLNLTTGIVNIIMGTTSGLGVNTGAYNVIIGANAVNAGDPTGIICLGYGSIAGFSVLTNTINIGVQSVTTSGHGAHPCADLINIGASSIIAVSAIDRIISIGNSSGLTLSGANANLFLMGHGCEPSSNSATNEASFGSSANPYSRFWFGNGGLPVSPATSVVFSPTAAAGSDSQGVNYTLAGGIATGLATGGSVFLDTSVAGTSGATPQSYAHGLEIDGFQRLKTYSGRIHATRVVTTAGAITVTVADDWVVVKKTVGAATVVNLPISPVTGTEFTITDGKFDAAANNITITPAAGNINNAGTYVMNVNGQSATIRYDGLQWLVV